VRRPSAGGTVRPLRGGGVDCKRDMFILNEIWAQDKIHILTGTLLS
jgi:hypothetical protein